MASGIALKIRSLYCLDWKVLIWYLEVIDIFIIYIITNISTDWINEMIMYVLII